MRENIPAEIRQSVYELSPEALVTLYRLRIPDLLGDVMIYFTPQQEVTWLGTVYDSVPCTLSGVFQNSDGEMSRPRLTIANPSGVFSSYVQDGKLDGAEISQYQVRCSDVINNIDVKITRLWRIARVAALNRQLITLELRNILDGHDFVLPPRVFAPPEFPHVSLD